MPSSLVKKDQLHQEIKKANFISRAFLIASVIFIVATVIISYYIVQIKGRESVMMAQILVSSEKIRTNAKKFQQELDIAKSQKIDTSLEIFLPAKDDYTQLTRLFDDLFELWDTPSNPIIANSVVYGVPTTDSTNGLAVLPVTFTVTSSVENFAKLLATLETSGLPDSNFRLVDIESIALNLGTNADQSNTIGYTLSLNAYFQAL